MPSRRAILITGAASVVIIGSGWFAADVFTASLAEAQEPWRAAAEGFGDTRLDILAYAILSPNPHNRQPWLIELIGSDSMRITADLDRMLPHTDPPNRQIIIGFGAFLELLRMAAAEKGYRTEIDRFPDGEPQPILDARPIAMVTLVREPGIATDPLFDAVLDRRTNREEYESGRYLTQDHFAQMAQAMPAHDRVRFQGSSDSDEVDRLKTIATEGWLIEYQTDRTAQESIDLMRIGADEINANPDGISMDGPMMEAGNRLGFISREGLADPESYAYGEGIRLYTALIDASPSFGWLTSAGNDRIDQLDTGAAWLRLHLTATRLGLVMQPLSQVLQEFPEMADHYRQLHAAVGVDEPSRVQGLFRMGYAAAAVPPSPRWPLTSRLVRSR